jgi:hypothetical protein
VKITTLIALDSVGLPGDSIQTVVVGDAGPLKLLLKSIGRACHQKLWMLVLQRFKIAGEFREHCNKLNSDGFLDIAIDCDQLGKDCVAKRR